MLTLTIFALFIILSVFFENFLKKYKINFGLISLTILCLSIFLRLINIETIIDTIIGDFFIQPWKILIIFFCSVYVATSVDSSGLLEHISQTVARKAKTKLSLFLYFYFLTGLTTLFLSNDIVVLTLTPIAIYVGKYLKTSILPILIAILFASNTFSMAFYTGDPTNITLASAMNFSYFNFTKLMILPTIAVGLSIFISLLIIFRKQLSEKINRPKTKPIQLLNKSFAYISATIVISMIGCLLFCEKFGWPIWLVLIIFAIISIIKDIIGHFLIKNSNNYLINNFKKIPWKLLPFILFFFIYTRLLINTTIFQTSLDLINNTNNSFSLIIIFSIISTFLANTINNHPATIALASIASNSHIVSNPSLAATSLAIVMSTSIGATVTTVGTLAIVMWRSILSRHGIRISLKNYLKISLKIVPISLLIGLITLYISIKIFL